MRWTTGGSSLDKDTGIVSSIFPYPALAVFQERRDVLSAAFSYLAMSTLAITVQRQTEPVKGQYVSGGYFAGIGVVPVAGRLDSTAGRDPGRSTVAVLSERFSRRRFGTPERAVGQTIRLNDKPFTVMGVAPASFFGAEPGAVPDVYVPLQADLILAATLPAISSTTTSTGSRSWGGCNLESASSRRRRCSHRPFTRTSPAPRRRRRSGGHGRNTQHRCEYRSLRQPCDETMWLLSTALPPLAARRPFGCSSAGVAGVRVRWNHKPHWFVAAAACRPAGGTRARSAAAGAGGIRRSDSKGCPS